MRKQRVARTVGLLTLAGVVSFCLSAASPAFAYEKVAVPQSFSVAHACLAFEATEPSVAAPAVPDDTAQGKPSAAFVIGLHFAFGHNGIKTAGPQLAAWSPHSGGAVALGGSTSCN